MAKRNNKRGRKPQYTRKQRKAARMERECAAARISPEQAQKRAETALAQVQGNITPALKAALQQAQRVAQSVQSRKGMQHDN